MLARWSADRMNARKTARMVCPLPTFCPQQRRPEVHAREPWKSRPRFAIRTDCRSAAALKRARSTSLGRSLPVPRGVGHRREPLLGPVERCRWRVRPGPDQGR